MLFPILYYLFFLFFIPQFYFTFLYYYLVQKLNVYSGNIFFWEIFVFSRLSNVIITSQICFISTKSFISTILSLIFFYYVLIFFYIQILFICLSSCLSFGFNSLLKFSLSSVLLYFIQKFLVHPCGMWTLSFFVRESAQVHFLEDASSHDFGFFLFLLQVFKAESFRSCLSGRTLGISISFAYAHSISLCPVSYSMALFPNRQWAKVLSKSVQWTVDSAMH